MFQGDIEKIEDRVTQLEMLLHLLRKEAYFRTPEAPFPMRSLALERGVELLFQFFTDIAALLIDRFILRDPGSYEDMVDILVSEEILSPDDAPAWKAVISMYRLLTRESSVPKEGNDGPLALLTENEAVFQRFPHQVRRFVEDERFPTHEA